MTVDKTIYQQTRKVHSRYPLTECNSQLITFKFSDCHSPTKDPICLNPQLRRSVFFQPIPKIQAMKCRSNLKFNTTNRNDPYHTNPKAPLTVDVRPQDLRGRQTIRGLFIASKQSKE